MIPQPVPEWRVVDERKFREEVVTQYRPAVLRGQVNRWPAARAGLVSPAEVSRYFDASDDDHAHIPEHKRGVLGKMSPEVTQRIRNLLIANVQR